MNAIHGHQGPSHQQLTQYPPPSQIDDNLQNSNGIEPQCYQSQTTGDAIETRYPLLARPKDPQRALPRTLQLKIGHYGKCFWLDRQYRATLLTSIGGYFGQELLSQSLAKHFLLQQTPIYRQLEPYKVLTSLLVAHEREQQQELSQQHPTQFTANAKIPYIRSVGLTALQILCISNHLNTNKVPIGYLLIISQMINLLQLSIGFHRNKLQFMSDKTRQTFAQSPSISLVLETFSQYLGQRFAQQTTHWLDQYQPHLTRSYLPYLSAMILTGTCLYQLALIRDRNTELKRE